ncbi:CDGP domain-containing protein [Mycolicibacterium parafortuitum]|uniref:CDGP domain-containing protein n=1 Tax=Mycolicibacterium parafortuitum TaxID=39692 RepID=A0A375YBC2_MYCPF|nr:hypothetical protein [Mycolicibacterium parafortuitum]ORB31837.1 hypothetical protein BST38_03540 [Mycolicibacterium parafortuitum]SRX78412.1 hypothetical protein MPP7335_00135 [Mycolicibacterium parafortuitum]
MRPTTKRGIAAGFAAALLPAVLLTTAPTAAAGCVYGGPVLGKCDGPVQADGNWERCVTVAQYVPSGLSSHLVPVRRCELMGPSRPPGDPSFADPPWHIDG